MKAVGDTCSNLVIATKWKDNNRIDVPSGFKTVQVTNAVVSSCSTEDSMFSVTCRVGNLTLLSEENELGGNYWRLPDGD